MMYQQNCNKTKQKDIPSIPGITIKKVHESYHQDPLDFESLHVKSEPLETCLVKYEPEESFANEEPSDDNGFSDPDNDDDDFSPDPKVSNSSSMMKVADLSFTCANCKISFDDFDTLTKHITSRVIKKPLNFLNL